MRIAIGCFCHETNSFGNVLMTLEHMHALTHEGQQLLKVFTGAHGYLGGMIDEGAQLGIELVPTRSTSFKPSGPSLTQVIDITVSRLVQLLEEANQEKPLDGIALFMHGAGAAPGYPDVEGAILARIREKLGYEIPIGVCLDLHGNISPQMVCLSNIMIGCKHYPHIDEYDTGRQLMRQLYKMIHEGYRTYQRLIQLPWHMVPAQGVTLSGPAHDVQQLCFAKEAEDPQLLNASFFQGFPYADVEIAGVSVVTVAKTQESADSNALQIARYAWDRRRDFDIELHSAQEAVTLALASDTFPVLINESSDNPGGGTPGDGTFLLRELLRRNESAAFGFICDPEVAQQAAAAGVGATIHCFLGGKTDRFHGEPIELDAYVKCISDGHFIKKSPMGLGGRVNLGTTVCLVVGNVSIVVGSARVQTFDDNPFRIVGINWQEKKLLALKSAQHFKGWWAPRCSRIIACDSPGLQTADLTTLPFNYARKDYYPLADPNWIQEIKR